MSKHIKCDGCGRECTGDYVEIHRITMDGVQVGEFLHLCRAKHGMDIGCDGLFNSNLRDWLRTARLSRDLDMGRETNAL